MNKTWQIIRYEYTRHVFRRRFIFALLSLPMILIFMLVLGVLTIVLQYSHKPVGYVDRAGLITMPDLPHETASLIDQVKFLPYPDENSARAALNKKDIQAYFVLPPDYRTTYDLRLVYLQQPPYVGISGQFSNLLRLNLLAGQAKTITKRVIESPQIIIKTTDAEKQPQSDSRIFRAVVPIAASYLMYLALSMTSGYMAQAVTEEKENRTMEILATSASPAAIMSGKIIALVFVGLTQILFWISLPGIALIFLAAYIPFLQAAVAWNQILLISTTILPTFVLFSTLITMIGSTFTEARESQQVAGLVLLPAMAPYLLATAIIANPSGTVAIILSFFPFTASLTLLFRVAFAAVPLWQILVSAAIVILTTAGAFWLAGRVFRAGMLRYGKRMGWKDVLQAVHPQGSSKRAA